MCAAIGPADYNYDETISTLRYANRAKSIKNKPKINEDPKDAMLREFQEEIARLKKQVELQQQGQTIVIDENGVPVPVTIEEKIVEKEVYVERDMGKASERDVEELEKKMLE